ncbi:hypothetical protein GCM10011491_33470 [Brucella endophytica]|uniref:ClbS/DfsB family four-helix bundle protein n=1 Tax=Brucella endophytica TaxID=1963359 RepID=A0A916WHU9_9HYPH|nr:ClbS/DfsB family four-helix bundle protein [Brucella endophytica]GGB02646.1 hypothetical protein GCM10011491_33470 [Brucella endophytica]
MAIPRNKDELLNAINTNFDRLYEDLASLPETATPIRTMEGHAKGTLMSAANLVSYLVGWNELVLKWLERDKPGQPVDFPETGFQWNELGQLARKFYQDYDGTPYPLLLERLQEAKRRIVAEVEGRDDATLYGRTWYRNWTMGRMIQLNTSSPYDNARKRLRKWKRQIGLRVV